MHPLGVESMPLAMATPSRRLLEKRKVIEFKPGILEELEPGFTLPLGVSAETLRKIIDNYTVGPDVVFVATYPKCGTTWMQQIVKLIWTAGVEDGRDIDEVLPWIDTMTLEEVQTPPSPQGFKTHLPYHLLPGGDPSVNVQAKYITVYRNPKDVTVSLFYHVRSMYPGMEIWDAIFEGFMSGHMIFGSYFKYVLQWWQHKDADNILMLSYEEMKKDPFTAISTVSSFLGYQLSEEVITSIAEQTNFDKMKLNPSANNSWIDEYHKGKTTPFMRKGVIGDWKNHFTEEQSARMDQEIAKNFGGTDIVLDFGNE